MSEIEFRGSSYKIDQVLLKLVDFITPERMEKIDHVVKKRSDFFVPVLEDL
jgi:hypothetical protein